MYGYLRLGFGFLLYLLACGWLCGEERRKKRQQKSESVVVVVGGGGGDVT